MPADGVKNGGSGFPGNFTTREASYRCNDCVRSCNRHPNPPSVASTASSSGVCGSRPSMESTAAALERTAASQGAGVKGVVRITASDVIGVEVLPPVIARLRHEHPDLKIELVLTNRVQDLLRREADIAVRMTHPKQETLIARRIGRIDVGLHATRQYLGTYGAPGSVAELVHHTLIGFDQETAFIRSARKHAPPLNRDKFSLRTDSDLAQLALIRAGAGIGICQVPIAKRSDALVRVLPRQVALYLETWITMHEDLRNRPSCRVTFEALVAGLQRHLAAAGS